MPAPRPGRDRTLTAVAGTGVSALALSHAPGLAPLAGPASVITLAAATALALYVLALAMHAVGRTSS